MANEKSLIGAEFQALPLDFMISAPLVAADASFQLNQSAAWQAFARDIQAHAPLRAVGSGDWAESYGRLENLAISDLALTIDVEQYSPPWWRRVLARVAGWLGPPPESRPPRYRIARRRKHSGPRLQLKVAARRSQTGDWEVSGAPVAVKEATP